MRNVLTARPGSTPGSIAPAWSWRHMDSPEDNAPFEGFRVRLGFTDGSEREVDLTPYLRGPIFERTSIRTCRTTDASRRVGLGRPGPGRSRSSAQTCLVERQGPRSPTPAGLARGSGPAAHRR